jgi:glycosyltransferase involved in cell wall biosynthesis
VLYFQLYQDTPGRAILRIVPSNGSSQGDREPIHSLLNRKLDKRLEISYRRIDSVYPNGQDDLCQSTARRRNDLGSLGGASDRLAREGGDVMTAPRPLRVMLLTSSLHYGGAERQVVELAKHLDRQRFEPMICCLDGTRTLFDVNPSPTPIVMARRRAKFDPVPFAQVAWTLWRRSIDVVHCFLFDAEVIGRLAGRLINVPAIIASERNSDYPPMPVKDRIHRLTRACVDLMIANSYAGKRYAVGHLGFDPEQVAVVHNAVDTDRFTPGDRAIPRHRLGIPANAPVVGMFASLKEQKNHAMYFRVARRILDRLPNTWFLCVSYLPWYPWGHRTEDAYQASLRELFEAVGLGDRMKILTDRNDVDRLYQACDLTLLTSCREGTPNVVLESMASGVPVIATDVADNALILDATSGGGVVPLDDDAAMADRACRLLGDADVLRSAAASARRAATTRHPLPLWASTIGALYEHTWARNRGHRPPARIAEQSGHGEPTRGARTTPPCGHNPRPLDGRP